MVAVNMEMPKNCAECPMYNSDVDDYCDITGEWITGEEMIRHKDCPLVEIVTCKDCRNCYPDEDGRGYHCERDNNVRFSVHGDFWCADGERRE